MKDEGRVKEGERNGINININRWDILTCCIVCMYIYVPSHQPTLVTF